MFFRDFIAVNPLLSFLSYRDGLLARQQMHLERKYTFLRPATECRRREHVYCLRFSIDKNRLLEFI